LSKVQAAPKQGCSYKLKKAKCEYLSRINPHEPKEFWKVVRSLNPKESTLKGGDVIASSDQYKARTIPLRTASTTLYQE